jgi:hypothetical protein
MTGPRLLAVARVALLAMLLAVTPGLAQQYKTSYKNGVRASDGKSWSEVATYMREAIAAQPSESADKMIIYGMRFEAYVPHYYLGIALKETGDCPGAFRELSISEQQGVVQGTDHYARLKQVLESCRSAVPPPTPAERPVATPTPRPAVPDLSADVKRAEDEIAKAQAALAAFQSLRKSPEYQPVWQEKPELASGGDAAAQKVEQARQRLGVGRSGNSVAELTNAAGIAADAAQQLGDLKTRAERRLPELRQAEGARQAESARQAEQARQAETARQAEEARRQKALQEITRLLGEAKRVQQLAVARQPAPADLSRQTTELARAIVDASNPPASMTDEQLEALAGRVGNATGVVTDTLNRPVAPLGAPGPPSELRQAAVLYLAADWPRLVQLLGSVDLGDKKANATAALLRGAARYALFLEGGGTSESLRQQAAADVRTCRQQNASLQPGVKSFSPRFVSFFQSTR